jgi:hypothetical protein
MIERAIIYEGPFSVSESEIPTPAAPAAPPARPQELISPYSLLVLADMDDEAGTIEVEIRLVANKKLSGLELVNVKVKSKITNPVEIIAVFLTYLPLVTAAVAPLVKNYALCVGAGLIYAGGALVADSYQESCTNLPETPARDRCRDIFRLLKLKGDEAKKHMRKALIECAFTPVLEYTLGWH